MNAALPRCATSYKFNLHNLEVSNDTTQSKLLTNSPKQATYLRQLEQVMQKMGVANFRNFCWKNSGISGLGKQRNFRKSGNRNFRNCNHYP